MYDLVADIRRYPEFLPWVLGMRVRKETETEAVADMIVGFKSLREQFTSRVVKHPKRHICVDYVDGPLKELHNEWRFEDRGEAGCTIDFEVDFSFRSRIFEALAGQFFESALTRMIVAFEQRADQLYGHGRST